MKKFLFLLILCLACGQIYSQTSVTGSAFIRSVTNIDAERRDEMAAQVILNGGLPAFMNTFARIDVQLTDSLTGKTIKAYYFVMPDYLCIGTNDDFMRMPMQPKTAQRIADQLNCFLSTKKICDDVYKAAVVKLEPRPLTKDRDSLYTFVEHNSIIEEQRQGRGGLIAGHKKDVIITHKIMEDERPHRLALYGWHKLDGNPIQPVYTGHIDWYVDYSHGFRLVQRTIYVEGKPMD